jgi:2-dehydropantoate 2-reductase
MKILFAGLGGVGGYYGGMLAAKYYQSLDVEVLFFARGEHLEMIKATGIEVITEETRFKARPHLASDNVHDFGTVDYVIISTKSYDLEQVVEQIKPVVAKNTVILPLLNGVDISERIEIQLPQATVWRGCSYIVARKSSPGVITTFGKLHLINFGYKNGEDFRLLSFEKLLIDAGIDAVFCVDIHNAIWKKFCFISVTAALTTYLNADFSDLLTKPSNLSMFIDMIKELVKVARAEGADQDESMVERAIYRISAIPKGSTTSMHSDFLVGNRTEVESLVGVVVRFAKKHAINIPIFEMVYTKLKVIMN